eukprot:856617-Pleurochrysis_carterae.AAC.1
MLNAAGHRGAQVRQQPPLFRRRRHQHHAYAAPAVKPTSSVVSLALSVELTLWAGCVRSRRSR